MTRAEFEAQMSGWQVEAALTLDRLESETMTWFYTQVGLVKEIRDKVDADADLTIQEQIILGRACRTERQLKQTAQMMRELRNELLQL